MILLPTGTARRNPHDVRQLHQHSLLEIVMPETRHEMEAERILATLSTAMPDEHALMQSRRLLAEALERAERRGRQISAHEKEASG
jgi:hypothetical protein